MDTINIFTEDTDLNIVKSWLCNSTDGQTYPFDRFAKRITCPQAEFRFDEIEGLWDETIGYKHDYKVDDPMLEGEAEAMLKRINEFIADVNANPDKFFPAKETFADARGCVYVCVEETPDLGKEVADVFYSASEAIKWVNDIEGADWSKSATAFEYSIFDLNSPNGRYAYRRVVR